MIYINITNKIRIKISNDWKLNSFLIALNKIQLKFMTIKWKKYTWEFEIFNKIITTKCRKFLYEKYI